MFTTVIEISEKRRQGFEFEKIIRNFTLAHLYENMVVEEYQLVRLKLNR